MSKNKYLILSVILSVVFVAAITYGATTISTNVNTGGTLTVSGASTLTGAVWATSTLQATGVVTFYDDLVVDTDTLFVDASADRVGIGTTTPSAFFSVGEAAGSLTGDVYLTGGLTVGASTTINSVEGTILLASSRQSDPTGVEGMLYYNASSKNVRLYNGAAWGVIGTSTGIDFSGSNITLSGMSNRFLLGTSTGQGNSFMVLEATSTTAIPLTIVARSSQTANLLQITDSGGTNLFAISFAGNASGTRMSLTDNFMVNGFATTTAASGNIATQGTLTVTGQTNLDGTSILASSTITTASTTRLTVSDYASTTSLIVGASTIRGLIFGYCAVPDTTITASTSAYAVCDSSTGGAGIRSGDRVVVMATSSLPVVFQITAASSTAANTISVRLYNTGETATTTTGVNAFNFIGIR